MIIKKVTRAVMTVFSAMAATFGFHKRDQRPDLIPAITGHAGGYHRFNSDTFDMASIMHARKNNQRNKNQKRLRGTKK